MVDWWLVRGLYCPIHWGLKKSNTGIPNKKQPGLNGMTEGFWTLLIFLKSGKADELLSWSDRHPGTLDILSDNTIVSDIPSGSIYILYYIYMQYLFWHSIWHSFWHLFWHSCWHSIWHSLWRLAEAEVRQCPLGSGPRSWGPAVPTEIRRSRLRSGCAHWDLELVIEVRQRPLTCGAHGWGPAV